MNLPAWHDAKAWSELVNEMKAAAGADGVSIEFDMPHGWIKYSTPETDE